MKKNVGKATGRPPVTEEKRQQQFTFYLDEDRHKLLKVVAAMTGVTLRELATTALEHAFGERTPEVEELHRKASEAAARIKKPFNLAAYPVALAA